ncbi:succinate dehydrogenase assembly factor 1, mitochondrial isoform X2 [Physcomitrium patens]|uniref:Complex 1 LYR protein domain-containing protein n=1 Tax=Physcomitrium patens TaxID=3218 RepID=A0A7I4DW41_PHYPA|nr:succinate dehydrogenase assembly factor 1, mitochondrial-like isoform X2 [Physcomitrium patens]|eukprot:XP_024372981.1 succinate dehydrogenase assembly factor 1, mitochondrial-like isoform X2 [Physcomitrella patens]
MARLSGMQKQVLSLYRSFLRAARIKPPESRKDIESFVGAEFRKYAQMDKKEFQSIEFLLRRGNKQLEMLKSPGVSGFSYVAPKRCVVMRRVLPGSHVWKQDIATGFSCVSSHPA